ncbi:MAG TPA: trehalase family glycosidase [Dongiaceae bacterium]|nr:trehalase family glycosidase [Dongiaceae bacterium]
MSESIIPLGRRWNSWDAEHPAAMRYLPLGLDIDLCAYAASRNSFTRFPAGAEGVRLGPRQIDGNGIALDLAHAGTELSLAYDKPDPFTLRGRWQAGRMAEWGLRFWVMLAIRSADGRNPHGVEWSFDPESGELSAEIRGHHVMVKGERPPLLTTFHDDLDALRGEYETKGYFCLDSRGTRGRFAVLRYHLEEMPRFAFAVSVGEAQEQVRGRASAALAAPAKAVPEIQGGAHAGALDAVRDVIGWNTVWDPINRRPYTSLSRNWVSQKFGGFGVWLDDIFYHAMMAGLFDAEVARENLRAIYSAQTAAGNFPCLVTGRDSWIDRTQPPVGSFICWILAKRLASRDLLREAWPALLANHEWWWATRDGNGDGLVEYGTSPVGGGLYRGTKLAAKDESTMDNSPTHDEARLDTTSWTLDSADVGLNSILALDGEMLALIATELGETAAAKRLAERTEGLKARIADRLWDPERQVFANRLWSGAFVRSLAPTSFYPLLCGAARPEQARAMVALLADPAKFGGAWLLPSVTRDDPAFPDNVYWRGRIWPPLNFLVYQGLKRAGFAAEASLLAENGYKLFRGEWESNRHCPENFGAVSGRALDQPDTDPFYGWGALMPAIAVAETTDITPWGGFEATHGESICLGPLLTPLGSTTIDSGSGDSGAGESVMSIAVGGQPRLRSNIRGRFRHIELEARHARLELPGGPVGWIEVSGRIMHARLDGKAIPAAEGRIAIPARTQPAVLDIYREGA